VHEVSLESLDVGGVVEEEQVAVEAEVELLAHLLLEALQPPDRLEPDANVQLVREQRPDTTGAVTRGARRERVALQQHRLPATELGEVAQRGRPQHASPDHDHIRALVHVSMIAYV
jgi:hypothetical protein